MTGQLQLLVFVPLLLAAISLPMALDMVGPNGFYGVRTETTRASEAVWHAANRAAGGAGVVAGLAGGAVNWRIIRSGMAPPKKNLWCAAVILGIGLLIAVVGMAAA